MCHVTNATPHAIPRKEPSMNHSYKTKGTCSTQIDFELKDGIIHNVRFTNGCNGNLKSISKLVEGLPAETVIEKLSGVQCGTKGTSCGDQFSKALVSALEKEKSQAV